MASEGGLKRTCKISSLSQDKHNLCDSSGVGWCECLLRLGNAHWSVAGCAGVEGPPSEDGGGRQHGLVFGESDLESELKLGEDLGAGLQKLMTVPVTVVVVV